MKVTFVSRADALRMIAEGYFADGKTDLISISDTNKEKQIVRAAWLANKADANAAIFLNFLDISDIACQLTDAKVRHIVKFATTSFTRKKDVVVHCFVGVSRSGAVAKFINDYWGLGDRYLEDYVGHNKYIYYTLLEAAGVPTLRSYYKNLEDNQ